MDAAHVLIDARVAVAHQELVVDAQRHRDVGAGGARGLRIGVVGRARDHDRHRAVALLGHDHHRVEPHAVAHRDHRGAALVVPALGGRLEAGDDVAAGARQIGELRRRGVGRRRGSRRQGRERARSGVGDASPSPDRAARPASQRRSRSRRATTRRARLEWRCVSLARGIIVGAKRARGKRAPCRRPIGSYSVRAMRAAASGVVIAILSVGCDAPTPAGRRFVAGATDRLERCRRQRRPRRGASAGQPRRRRRWQGRAPRPTRILIQRYIAGFEGESLIEGAVGPGCQRCTAEQIAAYHRLALSRGRPRSAASR